MVLNTASLAESVVGKAFYHCFDKICNMSNVNLISVSLHTGELCAYCWYWSTALAMCCWRKYLLINNHEEVCKKFANISQSETADWNMTPSVRWAPTLCYFKYKRWRCCANIQWRRQSRLQMIKHNCFVWMMYEALIAMFTLDCSQHPGLESDDSFLWGLRTEQNFLHIQCSSKISMS